MWVWVYVCVWVWVWEWVIVVMKSILTIISQHCSHEQSDWDTKWHTILNFGKKDIVLEVFGTIQIGKIQEKVYFESAKKKKTFGLYFLRFDDFYMIVISYPHPSLSMILWNYLMFFVAPQKMKILWLLLFLLFLPIN